MTAIERIKFMNHALYYLSQQKALCETNRDGLLTWNGISQLQAINDAQTIIRAAK